MASFETTNAATPRLRRALQTLVRVLSTPGPSETDALARLKEDTVFQPSAAKARASAQPDRRNLAG
jgi:hypothetical protein